MDEEALNKLKSYIENNFNEEEAEKLLDHAQWNKDILSGLATMHQEIRQTSAGGEKSAGFIDFINDQMKPDFQKVMDRLAGLKLGGLHVPDDPLTEIGAVFQWPGWEEIQVNLKAPAQTATEDQEIGPPGNEKLPVSPAPAAAWEAGLPGHLKKYLATGYLINLMA